METIARRWGLAPRRRRFEPPQGDTSCGARRSRHLAVKDGDPFKAAQVLVRLGGCQPRSPFGVARGQWFFWPAVRGRVVAERTGRATTAFADEPGHDSADARAASRPPPGYIAPLAVMGSPVSNQAQLLSRLRFLEYF